jgi:hypothetical protein
MNFFNFILNCFKRTDEQRAFEEQLFREAIKGENKKIFEEINSKIAFKEVAEYFVIQELLIAGDGSRYGQRLVQESGFDLAGYNQDLDQQERDRLNMDAIDNIFIGYLNKIFDEKLMIESSFEIIHWVMERWSLGKYGVKRQEMTKEELLVVQTLIDEAEKEAIYEAIKEPLAQPISEVKHMLKIDYTTAKVNELMEEYGDIIESLISGIENPIDMSKISLFKEHMTLATLAKNSHAIVLCCFFKTGEASLPVAIREMDKTSLIFFLQILDGFSQRGFSQSLIEYLEREEDTVWEMAEEENNPFMQYLIGLYYVCLEADMHSCHNAQKIWFEKSAENGFGMAHRKLEKLAA